jgi:hypothetical protein
MALYLEENLQMDYNHLEARDCFCTRAKGIGSLMCASCLTAIAHEERSRLMAMKPGEGIASAAAMTHNQMWRAKKGWGG